MSRDLLRVVTGNQLSLTRLSNSDPLKTALKLKKSDLLNSFVNRFKFLFNKTRSTRSLSYEPNDQFRKSCSHFHVVLNK